MQPVVRGRELGEEVGGEAVEGDVAQVEEPGPADGDVKTDREQDVEHGVGGDAEEVLVGRQHGDQRDEQDEAGEQDDLRRPLQPAASAADQPARADGALARTRDPLVGADLRGDGRGWSGRGRYAGAHVRPSGAQAPRGSPSAGRA